MFTFFLVIAIIQTIPYQIVMKIQKCNKVQFKMFLNKKLDQVIGNWVDQSNNGLNNITPQSYLTLNSARTW